MESVFQEFFLDLEVDFPAFRFGVIGRDGGEVNGQIAGLRVKRSHGQHLFDFRQGVFFISKQDVAALYGDRSIDEMAQAGEIIVSITLELFQEAVAEPLVFSLADQIQVQMPGFGWGIRHIGFEPFHGVRGGAFEELQPADFRVDGMRIAGIPFDPFTG
ncbi:MAG: hypothetical protein WD267_01870 [Balneolales bacterium]